MGKNGTHGQDGLDGAPGEDAFLNEYTKRFYRGDPGLDGFKYALIEPIRGS